MVLPDAAQELKIFVVRAAGISMRADSPGLIE
jgi:hypothetical protein